MAAVYSQGGYNIPANKYLSKTFQSTVLLTPSNTSRRTISTENYLRQIAKDFHKPPHPWGRQDSYGGRGLLHLKGTPTGHDMVIVAKGSQHYGSGMSSNPRGVQVQQLYSLTPSMKSNVRSNDEMIPSPTKINLQTHQVHKKYPAEHPFKSQTPKNEMFPTTAHTKVNEVEEDSEEYIHPADSPAAAPEQRIISKCRGSPYRHEEITIPLDTKRKPMTWPQQPFYQGARDTAEFQSSYPTPRTQYGCSPSHMISTQTAEALKDANNSLWKSMYQKDFSQRSKSAADFNENQKYLSKEAEIISNLVKNNDTAVPNITLSEPRNEDNMNSGGTAFTQPVYNGLRSMSALKNPKTLERHTASAPIERTAATTKYTPMTLEKTGLLRQFHTNHPRIEVPDLRASRDNRKLLFEKRHFIPEANGVKSYTIR